SKGLDCDAARSVPDPVCGDAVAAAPSAITATMAPTGTTSPADTRISASTPVVVDGTSIDTLSVSISNRLSPGLIASPAATNHFVILPSATVSPSCGISTSITRSLDPFPHHFIRGAGRPQDQPIAAKLVAAHQVGGVAGLHAALPVMGDGAGALVDRIAAEI